MTKWVQGVSNGMRLVGPRGGEVVAEILDKDNIQAANLIAAAPEMAELLERIRTELCASKIEDLRIEIADLLDKAEGK